MKGIVEGMFQNDTSFHYDLWEGEIPEDVNRVVVINTLDLVGRLSPKGAFSQVPFDEEKIKRFNTNYSLASGIPSPMTLVTDDGRVYHRKELGDKQRLPKFLEMIEKEGGIKKAIAKLED